MTKSNFAFTIRHASLLGLALLAGCRVGPKYTQPAALPAPAPPQYKEAAKPAQDASADWKVAQPSDAMLRGKWWNIYNDDELNDLEDKLNINNQTIKQFFEQYMEARTLIAQARSQLYPTVSIGPGVSRSQTSANIGNNNAATTTTTAGAQSSLFSIPVDVSWEPDLFGKIRNEIREFQYAAQVSAADLANEQLAEQASLATFLFQLRGQDALIDVFNKTIAADQKTLDLTRSLYNTGINDQVSVVQAENTLQNAQAAATNLGILRAQYEHAIAVLIGANPSTFSIPVKILDSTPPAIPIGLPSKLLERRPDVAAAERQMASENALIGVGVAAYYPTVSLTGEAGYESSAISKLLDWSSRYWSIGGTASETVFDAGLRRATIAQYIATYYAVVAGYRQTVLTAYQQVEDQIVASRISALQYKQQQDALASAQRAYDLEMNRYQTGVDPYLEVLTLQLTLLSDQSTIVTVRTTQMTTSVALIQALGGGWDLSDLPAPQHGYVHEKKAN